MNEYKLAHLKLIRTYNLLKSVLNTTIFLFILILVSSCEQKETKIDRNNELMLIPSPAKILKRSGELTFNNNFWVITDVGDTSSAWLGKYLVREIDKIPGLVATIADLYSTRKHEQGIVLEIIEDNSIHPQGYNLDLTSRIIKIQALTEQGLFNGVNTMLDILQKSWDKESRSASIRKAVIKDQPFYSTRTLDLTGVTDSLALSKLLVEVGQFKINSVLLSPEEIRIIDQSFFKNYQIAITSVHNISSSNIIRIPAYGSQIQHLFQGNKVNSQDSLVIKLDNFNIDKNYNQLLVASQLGWYGPSEKSYKLLEMLVDKENNN